MLRFVRICTESKHTHTHTHTHSNMNVAARTEDFLCEKNLKIMNFIPEQTRCGLGQLLTVLLNTFNWLWLAVVPTKTYFGSHPISWFNGTRGHFRKRWPFKNCNSLFVCFCAQNNTPGKRIRYARSYDCFGQNRIIFTSKHGSHLPVLISYRWTQSRRLIITTYSIQMSQPLSPFACIADWAAFSMSFGHAGK